MGFKKSVAVVMAVILLLTCFMGNVMISTASASASDFTDLSQDEMVAEMGAGWNLGNQLEASIGGVPYETAWGNPTITKKLIDSVKEAGFSTIRVPVSYLSHIGNDSNYTISSTWLDRVQEVVDMCIENDLYVIINMHGDGYHSVDGGWLFCDASNQTEIRKKYEACWKQIVTRFSSYDEHLIFESMNEEFDGTYGTPNRTYYSNINTLNQIFVDTVRKTGGNNDKRWLLIPGWNTNIEYTAGDYGFSLPTDNYLSDSVPAGEKRIMISVHYYDPWDFCGAENATITQWGESAKNSSKVASYGDESFLNSQFSNMYSKFVSKGYPVVIGEYGAIDKSSFDSVNVASRVEFAEKVCKYAKKYGCIPVWWDNGYNGNYGFGIFDRNSGAVTQQGIIDAIMNVYDDSSSPDVSEPGVTQPELSGQKVIFSNGASNQSYETADASWLMNASDKAIITLKYTCTDSSHAYWGILGWGASVNNSWKNGSSYNASSTPTATITVTFTVEELKKSLGITDTADVSYLALSAYNGGKIISLVISDSDSTVVPTAAPTVAPTAAPTVAPTAAPTAVPTAAPTAVPTAAPTTAPTATPTVDKVIFANGASNQSYETTDASWLMNASDNAVVTLKYTCADSTHGYWGILSWGASVNNVWKSGINYSALPNATDTVTVIYTAGELKRSLGITDGSNISYLALSAYNAGKIISLTISDV